MIKGLADLSLRHRWLRWLLSPGIALRRRWLALGRRRESPALDRLAGLLAEDPVLVVAEFDGRFALDPRSRLFRRLLEEGVYEPELTRRCVELLDPERDALDVGANIGFHSVLLAKRLRSGRVLAAEPASASARRLRRNLALNGVESRVIVFEGAVAASAGTAELTRVDGQEEFSTIGTLSHSSAEGLVRVVDRVPTRTLDELVAEHGLRPGLIKVDVEGMEHRVFEGAKRTLAEHRPRVVSELSDPLLRRNGSSAAEVVRFFESMGYETSDPLVPGAKAGAREYGDLVCVPR